MSQSRRTLTPLLLAICAVALGLIAQGYLARSSTPVDGLLVYGVVVVLFGAAVLRAARVPDLPVFDPGTLALRRAWLGVGIGRFALSMVLLLLAGISTVISLAFFRSDVQPGLRWVLHLWAVAAFILAVYGVSVGAGARAVARPIGVRNSARQRTTWAHVGALLAILAIGAFLRLYRFRELPYGVWYDEAENGLSVRQILANPSYRPVFVSTLPAHFLYLVAVSFRLLGDSVHAIRAVAVAFGMATILAAYFCGRELRGPCTGLALAFLLAVSRWDVNWSRIGMHGVTVPFFELWVVAALLRGLRTGRLTPFAWAGLALGLGFCFYSPIRVFPAVLVGFVLAWGLWWLSRIRVQHTDWSLAQQLRQTLSAWGVPALCFVLSVVVVTAPVAQFALYHPDEFWDRARSISLFSAPEVKEHPVRMVLDSTLKHLLMFNYRGDPNGRHNLPGKPMLDWLGGVLFVLGGVVCALRLRDPRSILVGLWVLVPLGGGIFSTWFEAPQSLRSIGCLPAVCALICLAMDWFACEWGRVFPVPGTNVRLMVLGTVVLLAMGVDNGLTYLYLWAHDFSSWAAFNPAETHMAQDINLYRYRYDLRFDPLLTAHLATRYLAPDYETYQHFDPATVFPIQGTDKEGVLLFVAPDTYVVRAQAQALYPSVRVETFKHLESGNVVLYKLFWQREEIAAMQGLDARYVLLQTEQGTGQNAGEIARVDDQIDLAWGNDAPVGYPFEVTWTGALLIPQYGAYTFQIETTGQCRLELDQQAVLSGAGSFGRQIAIAQGTHALYMDCRIEGPGAVRLLWATPDDVALRTVPQQMLYRAFWPVRGLVGRFYPNAEWGGEPAFVRIDRQIGYYFHFIPLARPYTVEWSGGIVVPSPGVYRFGAQAISWAAVYVDGQLVAEGAAPGQYREGEITLAAGAHEITVRYLDNQSHSQVYLYWQTPQGGRELIPFDVLLLPQQGAWWPVP